MKGMPALSWQKNFMNERELIIFKSIAPTLDLHEKYFILVNMFYTVKGSIIHNVINFCFMKGTSNRLPYTVYTTEHLHQH